MGYLSFNKEELINLEYSLKREALSTNRAGGYASTTIICCNTRKYHGLLVVPIRNFDNINHVLLSSLDETIVQDGQAFNLGIHKYPGVYAPKGHKYIVDFEYEPLFTLVYTIGNINLKKEILLSHNESQVMIKYSVLDSPNDVTLQLRPFLAFRSVHSLSKQNGLLNVRYKEVEGGICSKLYEGLPSLYMQISKDSNFYSNPDWFYNIEYDVEKERGYDFQEDLYVPGYFEVKIKKGNSIIFSASLNEEKPKCLKRKFQNILKKRSSRDNYINCLKYSASQFIVREGKDTEIVAGYPWFGRWGRDTFIALPGVTLSANNDVETCKNVLDTMVSQLKNGLFPNIGKGVNAAYNSIDAPLWFFWALQEYAKATSDEEVWKSYGSKMKSILKAFKEGINDGIRINPNGLLWAQQPGKALTWMDAVVNGIPVTPRAGYAVEINALWFNAVSYTLKLAMDKNDKKFLKEWKSLPEQISNSFIDVFWNEEKGYLADFVNENEINTWVRPNQVFACSLDYSPLTEKMKKSILDVVTKELLTPRGLRTLSPKNTYYQGVYFGDQKTRDEAYHQGTVWPWLIGTYIEANFKLYGKAFTDKAKELVGAYEEDITKYGLCSISEIYDGNPPHNPNGCISQAWSVGEVLRCYSLIEKFESEKEFNQKI